MLKATKFVTRSLCIGGRMEDKKDDALYTKEKEASVKGDKGETDVQGNRVCENVPVQRREDGGEPSEVVLAMEDLAGGEGGVGEGVVDQDLQRKHFFR